MSELWLIWLYLSVLLHIYICESNGLPIHRYDIFQSSDKTVYFHRHNSSKIHKIPDSTTITMLGYDIDRLSTKEQHEIDALTLGNNLPSLFQADKNPDEALR